MSADDETITISTADSTMRPTRFRVQIGDAPSKCKCQERQDLALLCEKFSNEMVRRLHQHLEKGRKGWDEGDPSPDTHGAEINFNIMGEMHELAEKLDDAFCLGAKHIQVEDLVDLANLCALMWNRLPDPPKVVIQ